MIATIDQFNEGYASVELFNYQFVHVMMHDLPDNALEGDIIKFKKGSWQLLPSNTAIMKKRVNLLFEKLLKK